MPCCYEKVMEDGEIQLPRTALSTLVSNRPWLSRKRILTRLKLMQLKMRCCMVILETQEWTFHPKQQWKLTSGGLCGEVCDQTDWCDAIVEAVHSASVEEAGALRTIHLHASLCHKVMPQRPWRCCGTLPFKMSIPRRCWTSLTTLQIAPPLWEIKKLHRRKSQTFSGAEQLKTSGLFQGHHTVPCEMCSCHRHHGIKILLCFSRSHTPLHLDVVCHPHNAIQVWNGIELIFQNDVLFHS